MKNKTLTTTLEATWDKDVVPAKRSRQRGLMIELTSAAAEQAATRHGVNLALVIDRSGSMGTDNMEAAKAAAIGVVEHLGEKDVLSIVDFDDRVTTLVESAQMTPLTRAEAIAAINTLQARGCTAMAAGWFEGARCAADVIDGTDFDTGHVVLLSDGHANTGMTDPAELAKHAAELASRGVTTSTVGVGDHYSPLQLDALAEGGGGRLHDAEGGNEIVEVIMGELGEARAIVANNVAMTIRWPAPAGAELLAHFEASTQPTSMTVHLGQLLSGTTRSVPLMFDVPGLPKGQSIDVEIVVEGRAPKGAEPFETVWTRAQLTAVPSKESRAAKRNLQVAERIARLWQSTVGYDAMRLNEAGDFAAARMTIANVADSLGAFADGTEVAEEICVSLREAEEKVSREWHGRSKRESMIAARKQSRGERDHRSKRRGDWSDHL